MNRLENHFNAIKLATTAMVAAYLLIGCSPLKDAQKLPFKSIAPSPSGSSSGGGTGGGTGGSTGGGATGAGLKPSKGSGGTIQKGTAVNTAKGATIYVPKSYDPNKTASGAIFLVNLMYQDFVKQADADNVFIIATNQYPDTPANQNIVTDRYEESYEILRTQYNLDMARVYLAGWSAGGNFILLSGSDPKMQQEEIAGYMVFPGSGGNDLYNNCRNNTGRKAALYYTVGDQDTGTGYAQHMPREANAVKNLPGYGDRVALKIWPGVGHNVVRSSPQVVQEAWDFVKKFNTLNN